jgi:hypothetical protein
LLTAALILACLVGAVLLGRLCRQVLPEQDLSSETRDTVKLALGLVATMAALLLGLLVSAAKGTYDAQREQVIQMAARAAVLDRVLALYGTESADARALFRTTMDDAIRRVWPADEGRASDLAPNIRAGDAVFDVIQQLTPSSERDLAERRALLVAQAAASVSRPLLVVVVCWLFFILFGFSVLAPQNTIAALALIASAASVSGAILLILELERPFDGLIKVSSEPLTKALVQDAA